MGAAGETGTESRCFALCLQPEESWQVDVLIGKVQ